MLPELQLKRSAKLVAPSSIQGRGGKETQQSHRTADGCGAWLIWMPLMDGCYVPRWWGWGVAFDQHENSIKPNYNLKARKWFAARRRKNAPGHKSSTESCKSWSWVVKRLKLALTLLGIWLANGPISRWCWCWSCCCFCFFVEGVWSIYRCYLAASHPWQDGTLGRPFGSWKTKPIPTAFFPHCRASSTISSPFIIRCYVALGLGNDPIS